MVPRHDRHDDDPSEKLPPPPPQPQSDRNTDGDIVRNPTADRRSAIGNSLQRETAVLRGKVRYIHAGGHPSKAQLTHAQDSALFVEGEILNLVWVNQDDIRALGVRFDMPEECPECGRPNDHPVL